MKINEVLFEDSSIQSVFKNNTSKIIDYAKKIQHYSKSQLINFINKSKQPINVDVKKVSRSVLIVILSALMLSSAQPQIGQQLQTYITQQDNTAEDKPRGEAVQQLGTALKPIVEKHINYAEKQLKTKESIMILQIKAQTKGDEFAQFRKFFYELTGTYPQTQIIKTILSPGMRGMCDQAMVLEDGSLMEPRIIIDVTRWDGWSEGQKQALIIHELAHCELGLIHTDGKDNIMYPNIPSDKQIGSHDAYGKFSAYAHQCGSKNFTKGIEILSYEFDIYSGGCKKADLQKTLTGKTFGPVEK